ncbi:MAG: YcaQ family DNA glycosylase [Microbacterium sp.]|uniref:DNA glycosylase AlkZ-like family protein n=1 Tax=Microbacterium sp. TaxID=51671 RepID=UPI001AC67C3C|nr:crosslink repair DNA glycosylase YcaQ family protein [Microbacterium sp.]MBN9153198.1 YcaQ family DNA glycosylase [Microbacterium sp.]
MVLTLSAAQARRIAVRAQLLTADRPGDIVETIDGVNVVGIDPTSAVAPSADHILWSRIGWPYQHADLVRAERVERAVFEWRGFYRLMDDLRLLLPEMRASPASASARDWLTANGRFRRDVLDRLRDEGPRHAAEIPDTAQVPWRSTGWTNNRNATQMLEILVSCGDVAVWGRDGKGRLFDLAERVYPGDVEHLSPHDAARERAERRLGALGIARAKGVSQPGEPIDVGDVGVPAVVEGVEGEWRVDRMLVDDGALEEPFAPRTALLSPLDRLVFDRERLRQLFSYEYVLEMYKPAAKRRWGYFALPILHGDRLIGKLDAKADHRAGVFLVNAVHDDVPFDEATAAAVQAEIHALARWLGLEPRGAMDD